MYTTNWPIGTALSLQATIELSIQDLPAIAQTVLYALSIFPPKPQSFSEEAALSVCNTTTEVLDLLVDCGLLECTQPGRYQVHQTIADYAQLHRIDPALETRLVTYIVEWVCSHQQEYNVLEQELQIITIALEVAFKRQMFTSLIHGTLGLVPLLETKHLYALANTLFSRTQQATLYMTDDESGTRLALYADRIAKLRCDFQQAEQI